MNALTGALKWKLNKKWIVLLLIVELLISSVIVLKVKCKEELFCFLINAHL